MFLLLKVIEKTLGLLKQWSPWEKLIFFFIIITPFDLRNHLRNHNTGSVIISCIDIYSSLGSSVHKGMGPLGKPYFLIGVKTKAALAFMVFISVV